MSGMEVVTLGGNIKANDFSGLTVILFATVHSCTFANSKLMFSASMEVLGEWINKQVLSANNRILNLLQKVNRLCKLKITVGLNCYLEASQIDLLGFLNVTFNKVDFILLSQ